ncbi:hypothetical protein MG293_005233 [Ovis ammon polii]|uniref:Uncharacterized protein n=1 Tax=Ovis ammon polii TaxID=230172 RepID=A0AAD4UEF7_OVIAM|nr:hypothetical protein MG293_005233 [Ovis ammon polii]
MQTTSDAEDERRPTAVGMFDVMTLAGDIGGGQASKPNLCYYQLQLYIYPEVLLTSIYVCYQNLDFIIRKREKTSPEEDYMFHTLTLLEMDLVKFVSSPQNLTQHVNRRLIFATVCLSQEE